MFSSELTYHTVKFDEGAWRQRRHLLHVDASHGPASVVAHGARAFLAGVAETCPQISVEHLELWDEGEAAAARKTNYGLGHVKAKMDMLAGSGPPPEGGAASFAGIEELAAQVASAQGLVVSAPLWNYGPPHALKRYFDCVLHPGLTFKETPQGPRGLLGGGRPLVIITSAGGAGTKDYFTPWLIDVAAMMGFDEPTVISATNATLAERQQLLDAVARDAEAAAHRVGTGLLASLAGATRSEARPASDARLAKEAAPDAGAGAGEDKVESVDPEWGHEDLLRWLKDRGGFSEDALEAIHAAKVNGELWFVATADDWRSEELGLEEADVERLVSLQGRG